MAAGEMTIPDLLHRFRSGFEGSFVVIFADLDTGTVLAHSATRPTAQENLDDLCRAAIHCFAKSPFDCRSHKPACTEPLAQHAVTFDSERLKCFIRLPLAMNEALCVECDLEIPLRKIIADGADLLVQIARGAR